MQTSLTKAFRHLPNALCRANVARSSALSTGGRKRDEWESPEFAREWTLGGGADKTNPDRARFQRLLGALCTFRLEHGTGDGLLDLGCGSGLSAQAVVDAMGGRDFRLAGVDGSAAMLKLATGVCPAMETAEVDFAAIARSGMDGISDTAAALLYGNGEFSAVMCSQVLHELPPDAKGAAVRLARSVLGPGGCFYVADRYVADCRPSVRADDYAVMWEVLTQGQEGAMPWVNYASYMADKLDHATSQEECVELLQAEFDDVEVLYSVFNRSLIVARVSHAVAPHADAT